MWNKINIVGTSVYVGRAEGLIVNILCISFKHKVLLKSQKAELMDTVNIYSKGLKGHTYTQLHTPALI